MTWREALKLVARDVRRREANVRNTVPRPFIPPEQDRAIAMNLAWIAEHLEYVVTLPPHEGLRELRKLGGS